MLEFAERLTLTPTAITRDDVDALRGQGFEDGAIFAVTLAAAYRNYIVRVADTLGVELRKDGGYAPEILRAFGVTADDVGTTIYADRLTSPPGATPPSWPPVSRATRAGGASVWIDTTPTDGERFARAQAELERLTAPHPLTNLARVFARRSEVLASTIEFGRLLGMGGSGLGGRTEAIIGLVVAGIQGISYLAVHHAQRLLDHGASVDEVTALAAGAAPELSSDRERAIMGFCARAARAPSTMSRADVQALRAVGLDDRAVLTVAAAAAFESFLGGVAAGLGVELEDDAVTVEAQVACARGTA